MLNSWHGVRKLCFYYLLNPTITVCTEHWFLMQPTSHAHLIKADRWGSRQWTPTCDEARVCEPVFGVVCVVAQVSDLHVAIVDAENKSQGKGDARCCFTPSD